MSQDRQRDDFMRYHRQVFLPSFGMDGQEKLFKSRVLVVGAGGLGCAALQYLVGAGVGHLTVIDDDTVEITNLHRQVLHGEESVGRSKCTSAAQAIRALNSKVSLTLIEQRLSDSDLAPVIDDVDVVVDCCDNLPTRQQLNRLTWHAKKPLISGAAIRMEGQVSCFDARRSDSPCYQCLSQFFGEQNLSCVESGILSPIVGIIGCYQALEAIKLLTDVGDVLVGRLALFDGLASTWAQFKLPKSEQCSVCCS